MKDKRVRFRVDHTWCRSRIGTLCKRGVLSQLQVRRKRLALAAPFVGVRVPKIVESCLTDPNDPVMSQGCLEPIERCTRDAVRMDSRARPDVGVALGNGDDFGVGLLLHPDT